MSDELHRKLVHAQERFGAGDAAGASALCREVLQQTPGDPNALSLLGIAHLMNGRAHDAVAPLQQALTVQPLHGAALENLGLAYLILGQFPEAELVLRRASAIAGAPASVFMRLGAALLNQGRHADAVAKLRYALELDPNNAEIYLNLGQAAELMGDPALACRHFEFALTLEPNYSDAMYNLGVLALYQNQLDTARDWFERSLNRVPDHIEALLNLGIIHGKQRRFEKAVGVFRHALSINKNLALAFAGIASARFASGTEEKNNAHLNEAETAAQRAVSLDPTLPEVYILLGEIYALRGARDKTIEVLEAGYKQTDAAPLLGSLLFQLRYVCDWKKWQKKWADAVPLIQNGDNLGSPFQLLCQPLTASEQLNYARRWAVREFGAALSVPPHSARARRRMRIGYISSNFGDHAVSDLLIEVLESHERARFEIYAYSCGADDRSAMRDRLIRACEHFIDLFNESDEMASERIRADELDILVDLNGYTRGARTGVLSRRPCARQMSWLGYPGTMGADFIDYLIADPFVIPAGQEDAYSERLLRMPNCYLPTDRQRGVAPPLARSEYGLPENAFVFCCFNQVYKITSDIFSTWMRLLNQIPESVLWLPEDNRWATEKLLAEALAQDVNPTRLHFAQRLPNLDEHLARYSAADLALDTFAYGSHTTAIDALWAGCPLVALCGNTFASRVSGSILTACRLPELIAYTLGDYEQLALRVARDKFLRKTLREKIRANRLNSPLFNSMGFTQSLENIYLNVARKSSIP